MFPIMSHRISSGIFLRCLLKIPIFYFHNNIMESHRDDPNICHSNRHQTPFSVCSIIQNENIFLCVRNNIFIYKIFLLFLPMCNFTFRIQFKKKPNCVQTVLLKIKWGKKILFSYCLKLLSEWNLWTSVEKTEA